MSPAWSSAIPCAADHATAVPAGPVLYRASLLDEHGSPKPIPRFWQPDNDGILLIGETVGGRNRFRELAAAIRGEKWGRGHGPGESFNNWFRAHFATPDRVVFQWYDLRAAPEVDALLADKRHREKVAVAAELLAIEHYRWNFGDLPPCNTQHAKSNAVTTWMQETWGLPWGYMPEAKARLNIPFVSAPGIPPISLDQARQVGEAELLKRQQRGPNGDQSE